MFIDKSYANIKNFANFIKYLESYSIKKKYAHY